MDQETLGQTIGWAGGILGSLLGVLGGGIGTYFSIKKTKGPRERVFVIRASLLCWIGVSLYFLGIWFLPITYTSWLGLIFVFVLLSAMRHWNRRQAAIRAEESNRAA